MTLGKEEGKVETTVYALPLVHTVRQGAAEAFMVVSSEGRIRSANRAAELLLGHEPGQLIDMYFPEMWYSPRRSGLPADGVHPQTGELIRRDGELVPVTISTTPLASDPPGDRLLMLVREDDRLYLNELLLHVQRLTGVGTMTASVAHELTSPLSIISASLDNMQDVMAAGNLTQEQLAHYLEMMSQSVARAARIVEVLRHYTHNDGELSMAITSAADIVGDALVMVEQQFRKRAHVEVETTIEGNLEAIVADHNRLTQVLVNLLLNARDAMQPDGGTIRVRFWPLAPTGDTGLLTNGSSPRDYFAFSVSDDGPGIAPDVIDHLFEPFFTTKANGQGTGLGLFISKGIVATHNGRIWAENNPDGGVTFIVVLPKRPR